MSLGQSGCSSVVRENNNNNMESFNSVLDCMWKIVVHWCTYRTCSPMFIGKVSTSMTWLDQSFQCYSGFVMLKCSLGISSCNLTKIPDTLGTFLVIIGFLPQANHHSEYGLHISVRPQAVFYLKIAQKWK